MKFWITSLFILASQWMMAQQTPISLYIQHSIDDKGLTPGEVYSSNQGNFMVTRLSYYLSDIQIIHDGGLRTPFPDLYLLVHGNQSEFDLGEAFVNSIEGIAFNVGVDSTTNHADPALWPAAHPLAFQSPSMHWGWASGYRFLAFEGLLDKNQDGDPEKIWEFHVVGDALLTHVEVMLDGPQPVSESGTIHISGDYFKLFNGVSMDNILHGSGSLITKMMSNFVNGPVFTGQNLVSSTNPESLEKPLLTVLGNPAQGVIQVAYTMPGTQSGQIRMVDSVGKLVASQKVSQGQGVLDISIPAPGSYHIFLEANQQILVSQQIIGL